MKAGVPALPNRMLPNAAASLCYDGARLCAVRFGGAFGRGWAIEETAGRQFLWQWGDNSGYKNFVMVDPVAEAGVFVFTNGDLGQRVCERVVTAATGMGHPALDWLS